MTRYNLPDPGSQQWYSSPLFPAVADLDRRIGKGSVDLSALQTLLNTGRSMHIRSSEGAANFVKPTSPAARIHWVRAWGAGGAGGGTVGAASGLSEGGGGGGGGYVEYWYLDSELSASEPYVVGAGGIPVIGALGNSGGSTTFKGLNAGSGGGGSPMTSSTATQGVLGGDGGTANGGHLNSRGDDGGFGRSILGVPCFNNFGGGSPGGGGSRQQRDLTASSGNVGLGPGGGGTGSFSSTVSYAGGAGADGKILIASFF
jgi:hypothetical protein